jgi:hypothetical protein
MTSADRRRLPSEIVGAFDLLHRDALDATVLANTDTRQSATAETARIVSRTAFDVPSNGIMWGATTTMLRDRDDPPRRRLKAAIRLRLRFLKWAASASGD